jgi:hypothetical protein
MRLVEWNCRMALHRKLFLLKDLNADLAIVPECAENLPEQVEDSFSFAWKGHNPKKGLGVLGFNGWGVDVIDDGPRLPWVLPVRVNHASQHVCDLLAVWTVAGQRAFDSPYGAQVTELIDTWSEAMTAANTLIAGDFNTSIQGPSSEEHRANLDRFSELGMISAYHHAFEIDHGDEPDRTLRWIGPGRTEYRYMCDFVFVPDRLLHGLSARVEQIWDGEHAGLSDHQPVVVDLPSRGFGNTWTTNGN